VPQNLHAAGSFGNCGLAAPHPVHGPGELGLGPCEIDFFLLLGETLFRPIS
jgi:hypothetical protein